MTATSKILVLRSGGRPVYGGQAYPHVASISLRRFGQNRGWDTAGSWTPVLWRSLGPRGFCRTARGVADDHRTPDLIFTREGTSIRPASPFNRGPN